MRVQRAAILAAVICATLALRPQAALSQGSLLPLPEQKPIRGANFPALSPDGKTLCFGYLGDLWTVPATGGTATRITIHEADDTMPHWSPDGRWIAFTSNREGNWDVYVISAQGGPARQLTFHSSNDWAMDWSPDGSKVLFYGQRATNSFQLYAIDIKTGVVKTITNDSDNMIRYGSYSPDGQSVAYDRCGSIAVWWRPKYHGSANMEIYSKNLSSGKITRVTDYDGTDLWPMYSGDGRTIFYASDRLTPGFANIVANPATGGKPTLLTNQKSGQVRFPSIARGGSAIAYELSGDLYMVPVSGRASVGDPKKLAIYAATDDKTNNISRLTMANGATEAEISPDGKTLALVIRGEIWSIPTSGGDAKRLTANPARDYDIIWSADSKKLYFISDRNGSFNLFCLDVTTKEVKPVSNYTLDESSPKLSPDGKSLAFLRSGVEGGIFVWPVDGSAAPRRVAESKGNNLEFGVGINSYSWSPDNKWIAFSRRDSVDTSDVWVAPVSGGAAKNVTYYPGTNNDPEWTSDGKYLLFVSSRDGQEDIYKLPLVPEKEEDDTAKPAPAPNPAGGGSTADAKKPVEVKIDFDEIQDRAKRLTTQGTGNYQITPDGKQVVYLAAAGGAPDFYMIPVAGGSASRLTSTGVAGGLPRFTTDAGKFYALAPGGTVNLIQRTGPIWQAQPVAFSARMDFDRRAEIRQAFNEFWRRMNVGFYDPNMHGVDWRSIRAKYEPLLEGVGTKEEFSMFLLSAMVGELNASHSEVGPAPGPPGPQTGELGISFDENYAGPGLKVTGYMPKGPNDDLGPKVKVGEYILSIDGEDVSWTEAMYQTLVDKAGKTVELLVNSKPTKEGARTVKLKPITVAAWRDLEYDRKVKEERAKVAKLSDGRIAYLHIKGMDQPSLQKFERELWGRGREADALVLDIRENGGGNTHDAILGQLSRTLYGFTQPRDADKVTQPVRYWGKPIVLLIDQNSASDAEIFPMGFRNLKLGKIVGVPTPGYVIGTYSGRLQDGTTYRIPMWGWFGPDGKDMENVGVKPDVTVEETEQDLEQNRDRQLEVAVDLLLKELPKKKG